MHQPILRKDTKADRLPPARVLDETRFATPAARDDAADAAAEAAWWLRTLTREAH